MEEYSNIKIKFEDGVMRYGDFQGAFFTFHGGHRVLLDKETVIESFI